jgi:hypothetical protein|tara:strand:+ start:1701 stop:2042 length:342 start_codon:yes stop_codon:yes gene_type:complete
MKIAGEPAGATYLSKAHTVPSMRTRIEEGVNVAVFPAGDNDRILTYRACQEIPNLRQLRIMGNEDPASGKDSFQFERIDILLPENPAIKRTVAYADPSAYFRTQFFPVGRFFD